jgi:hexosaminidase
MRTLALMLTLPVLFANASGAETPAWNLMPVPAKISVGQGRLAIDQTFQAAFIGVDAPLARTAVERMIQHLSVKTGMPLKHEPAQDPSQATLVIHCDHASEAVQKLGEDESYRLEISTSQARLDAPNPLGVIRGLETFLQLVDADQQGFMAPAVSIEDQPRFPWRGFMLDVSRHWMPLELVKRNLDGMAAVKLNVFHWHLTDDQGFRVESKRFPKLHAMGSDGLFYTQKQVHEVIEYARERGIRVVPEFDIPAHTSSWLVGYPELASAAGPHEIGRHWGVYDPVINPAKESTYQFLDAFIGEMAGLFPDEYFHIGGDEVNPKEWNHNPRIQLFARKHALKDANQLQAYFNKRIQAIVAKHGKRMEGWDEILNPNLPKSIVIQSWRGPKSLAEAARLGYSGLLSSNYYLDLMRPASLHYLTDPLGDEAAALSPEQQARILGGEAAMWCEFAAARNVDSRIWPRLAVIAERLWSPAGVKDVDSMYRRMELISRQLELLGLTHRSSYNTMLAELAGGEPVEPLRTLAEVVEPVKGYARVSSGRKYTQQTPLNRLVDAAEPESMRARDFAALVDRMDRPKIREWLVRWSDNDAKLEPMVAKSFLLAEVKPLSEDLSKLARIGLEALNSMESGEKRPPGWLTDQRAFLAAAKRPRAELLLMIIPSIDRLISAAASSESP